VNGKTIEKPAASASYDRGVPDFAEAIAKDNVIVINLGEPVKNRTNRNVPLLKP
jgi:hypothetical protein